MITEFAGTQSIPYISKNHILQGAERERGLSAISSWTRLQGETEWSSSSIEGAKQVQREDVEKVAFLIDQTMLLANVLQRMQRSGGDYEDIALANYPQLAGIVDPQIALMAIDAFRYSRHAHGMTKKTSVGYLPSDTPMYTSVNIPAVKVMGRKLEQKKESGDALITHDPYVKGRDSIGGIFDGVTNNLIPNADIDAALEIYTYFIHHRSELTKMIAEQENNPHGIFVSGSELATLHLHSYLKQRSLEMGSPIQATGVLYRIVKFLPNTRESISGLSPDDLFQRIELTWWGDTKGAVVVKPHRKNGPIQVIFRTPSSLNDAFDAQTIAASHISHDKTVSSKNRQKAQEVYRRNVEVSRDSKYNLEEGVGVGVVGYPGDFASNTNSIVLDIPAGYDYKVILYSDGFESCAFELDADPVDLALAVNALSNREYFNDIAPIVSSLIASVSQEKWNRKVEARSNVDDISLLVTGPYAENWIKTNHWSTLSSEEILLTYNFHYPPNLQYFLTNPNFRQQNIRQFVALLANQGIL